MKKELDFVKLFIAAFLAWSDQIVQLQARFVESLENLSRFWVPRKLIWPLACKVFDLTLPNPHSERQKQTWEQRRNRFEALGKTYFDELGDNAYAALNVLTDFATRPEGFIASENVIDSLQKKTGTWVEEFIDLASNKSFRLEEYLADNFERAA